MKPTFAYVSAAAFALAATFAGATPVAAARADYDAAVGQVMAASLLEDCKGVTGIGGGSSQQFVLDASDLIAKQQGLRKNKLRKTLFYGKTDMLVAIGKNALQGRGLDPVDENGLCRFARKVAGTDDAIGRFLVKE